MLLYNLILLPALVGILCASVPMTDQKRTVFLLLTQGAETAVAIVLALRGDSLSTPVWHITDTLTFSLILDPLGAFFTVLTCACWLLTIPYASVYMHHEAHHQRFYAFFFTTEAAVIGAALAADLVTFYLFFELTTVLSAPLVLHDLSEKAIRGASKYFYYSVGGAFLALFGMAVLLVSRGDLLFVKGGTMTDLTPLEVTATAMILIGFGAKAGLYPLHNWLPAAHPVAPAPAHALLSGIIAKVGAIGVLRVILFLVGTTPLYGSRIQYALLALALLTIAMGSFLGCLENNLKKRLAYSSISQLSYVLLGLFIITPHGLEGALLQILFHALSKIGIFQCAGAIIFLTGYTQVDQLRGIGRRIPMTMVCFAFFSLSLVGIPPFGGFWSKWHLCLAALEGLPPLWGYLTVGVLILSALLTAGYLFAPVVSAFFPGEDCPEELLTPVKEPKTMMISLVVLALAVLLLGLFPAGAVSAMQRIAEALT